MKVYVLVVSWYFIKEVHIFELSQDALYHDFLVAAVVETTHIEAFSALFKSEPY